MDKHMMDTMMDPMENSGQRTPTTVATEHRAGGADPSGGRGESWSSVKIHELLLCSTSLQVGNP